jgi:RimJ/RimL family protein N-acetyltransferase
VRVTIRRARPEDADFLFELVSDEDTRPFLARAAETRDDLLAEIARSEREPAVYGRFVVEEDGEPVGTVGFTLESERHRIAGVGRFAIHPRFRGRRIGDEAARVFQRHLLVDLGFHRIELQIYAFNERAIAHAERSGFVREGVKRRAYFRDDRWQDAVVFSLLDDELV